MKTYLKIIKDYLDNQKLANPYNRYLKLKNPFWTNDILSVLIIGRFEPCYGMLDNIFT